MDADDGLKTILTSQNNTSDEETNDHENKFYSEIDNSSNNNGTNDIITIQAKLSLNKYNNDATPTTATTTTTEKVQLKAEKIVDNYAVVSEPHESNNVIGDNSFSDVDTNFIDIGQQAPRNSSNSSSSKFQF